MATRQSSYAVVGCRHCDYLWILDDLRPTPCNVDNVLTRTKPNGCATRRT